MKINAPLDSRDQQGVLEYVNRLAENVRRKQEANKTLEEEADEFAVKARESFSLKRNGRYKPHLRENQTRAEALV